MSDLIFHSDEISFIKNKGFYAFNWLDLNVKKPDNGNNILMDLLMCLSFTILKKDIETILSISFKFILNKSFDINSENYAWSTVLSNIIQLWIPSYILDFILENRDDVNIGWYETQYGKTYLDLAIAFERDDIVEILKKKSQKTSCSETIINKSMEELISDWDLSWIVNLCKNNLSGDTAGFLYNAANLAWQYYNDNELAIKLYNEAIKYNSADPFVYNNLATVYKRLWNYDHALKNYCLSLKYDRQNLIRYLRPALLYAYIWDNENALDFLESYFGQWWSREQLEDVAKNTTQWWRELLQLYTNL